VSIRLLLPLLLLVPAAAPAQQTPSTAASAADKFSLDIPVDETVTAPVAATPPAATPSAAFSLDTPIAALITDPAAKAVLDRNLPDLSTDPNIDKFKALSLRRLAPLSGGQLTAALLTQTERDLAGVAPTPPAKARVRPLPVGR
jgi:hypothetical protein